LPAERRGSAATRHASRITRHCRGVSARFGIRAVEAREGRIWLNGKPVWLKGANRHDAHPTFGAATPDALMALDIQNLKALGCNFVRGAHYPQSRRFLDLCDENGLLVWEESLGWGNGQSYTDREGGEFADARFAADQLAQTRLMVEKSFNHPSVIIFAFMNEFASQKPEGKALADKLIDAIRSQDSGRLVTFACNHTPDDISNANTDIVAFNTYPGWIGTDAGSPENLRRIVREDVDKIVSRFRSLYPDKPIMVSEMGTCGVYGQHDAAGAQWTEEFQAEYVGDTIDAAFANKDICGFTIWQFTDARSYHRGGATIRTKPFAQNLAGLFDGFRRPKLVTATVRERFAAKNA
jgi:beta-glucuronidase